MLSQQLKTSVFFFSLTSVAVDAVGDLLQATVGEGNVVGSGGVVAVPLLVLAEVVVGVVVLDLPLELVLGGHGGVLRLVGGGGVVGVGEAGGGHEGSDDSDEGLKERAEGARVEDGRGGLDGVGLFCCYVGVC